MQMLCQAENFHHATIYVTATGLGGELDCTVVRNVNRFNLNRVQPGYFFMKSTHK